jgi:hypothetical protein
VVVEGRGAWAPFLVLEKKKENLSYQIDGERGVVAVGKETDGKKVASGMAARWGKGCDGFAMTKGGMCGRKALRARKYVWMASDVALS